MQCCRCKKYVSIELLARKEDVLYPVTYIEMLEEYELQDQFICEDCAAKASTNIYELTGDALLQALDIETCSDPYELYDLDKRMFL